MCSTLRPAGAIVHGEARGEGLGYSARAASPPCPLDRRTPTASTDGTSVGTSSIGRGAGGEVAASGVHLALSRLVLRELAIPCRVTVLLWRAPARPRLLRLRFDCAAQRSGTRFWPGRPRRRRAAAAPRWRRFGHWPRQSSAECACTADGGGDSDAALRRFAASGNGAPEVALGVHVGAGCNERSEDSAIAVVRRNVQRGVATAVHGGAGAREWTPQGTPVPNRYPNTKQQPTTDYGVVLGSR
jgi:hypothetical protein